MNPYFTYTDSLITPGELLDKLIDPYISLAKCNLCCFAGIGRGMYGCIYSFSTFALVKSFKGIWYLGGLGSNTLYVFDNSTLTICIANDEGICITNIIKEIPLYREIIHQTSENKRALFLGTGTSILDGVLGFITGSYYGSLPAVLDGLNVFYTPLHGTVSITDCLTSKLRIFYTTNNAGKLIKYSKRFRYIPFNEAMSSYEIIDPNDNEYYLTFYNPLEDGNPIDCNVYYKYIKSIKKLLVKYGLRKFSDLIFDY